MTVADLLADARVCVCAGPGGVGKTTTSAAIALGMAARGSTVAVVTIDPARRLADALGLEQLGNEPRRIAADRFPGVELSGELWAMMLDPKRTFDELIEEVSPDTDRAAEIKQNRIYAQLSGAVAGSQEFTAISKLYELARSERFDLIVLDTPPAQNAIDFLEAPKRLSDFLDGRALQAFLKPTGVGARLLSPLLGALRRLTGVDLVGDLTTFFGLLGGMTDEFSARAQAVQELLRSETTAFLITTTPGTEPVDEAIALGKYLQSGGFDLRAAIVNRVDPAAAFTEGEIEERLREDLDERLARAVLAAWTDHEALRRREAAALERLRHDAGTEILVTVPQFDEDVHDVEGLIHVRDALFSG